MTVRELLEKMEGVSSYGVYTKNGDTAEPFTDSKTIIKYLDRKVNRFTVGVYYEESLTRIRCCIYMEDE